MNALSLIQQNYIETIYNLCREHGHAHTKDIAQALQIKMASATEVLQTLSATGYVNYRKRSAVTLTRRGEDLPEELQKRHEILAEFFRLIGCSRSVADEAACRVEHNIDGEIAHLLEEHVKKLLSGE